MFFWWPILAVSAPSVVTAVLLAVMHARGTVDRSLLAQAFQSAAPATSFAPMLCTFFVAVGTLSCDSLSTGAAPPPETTSMGVAIYVCSAAFVVQAVLRIYFEYRLLKADAVRLPGYIQASQERFATLKLWCQLSVAATYVWICVIVISLVDYPLVDTPLACCVLLAVAYFGIYLAFHVATFDANSRFGAAVLKLAALNLNFAPMFGTLFLAVKMVTVSAGEEVSDDTEAMIRVSTTALLLQTAVAVITPLVCGAELQEVGYYGQEDLVIKSRTGLLLSSAIRWVLVFAMYASLWAVYGDLWAHKGGPNGEVVILCWLTLSYFGIYSLIWALMSFKQLGFDMDALYVFINMKDIIAPTPIVCALLLGWWFCSSAA